MATLDWGSAALTEYGRIAAIGGLLHERLDDALDLIEDDVDPPSTRSFRDRHQRLVHITSIRTYTDEVALVWQRESRVVYIAYLGPDNL